MLSGGAGRDTLIDDGGDNVYASYRYAKQGVSVNLSTGVANAGKGDVDRLVDIRSVYGSDFRDTFFAVTGAFEGFAGDDVVTFSQGGDAAGGEGDDRIRLLDGGGAVFGGAGDDTISAVGGGNDVYDGGEDDDRITVDMQAGFVLGGDGNDTIKATISGEISGQENRVDGGAGDDVIDATIRSGEVRGGADDDVIRVTSDAKGLQAVRIDAGAGDDLIELRHTLKNPSDSNFLVVRLGDGEDTLNSVASGVSVKTGAGDDVLTFDFKGSGQGRGVDIVFAADRQTVILKHAFSGVSFDRFDVREDVVDISAINGASSDSFKELKALAQVADYGFHIEFNGVDLRFVGLDISDMKSAMFIL